MEASTELKRKQLRALTLLIPLALAIHNLEEIVTDLPGHFKEDLPSFATDFYQTDVFILATTLITILVAIICMWINKTRTTVSMALFVILTAALTANVISHLGNAIREISYTPGLVTAVLLFMPLVTMSYGYALRSHLFTTRKLILLSVFGALSMPLAAVILLFISHTVLR